jgi:ribosomal protein S2
MENFSLSKNSLSPSCSSKQSFYTSCLIDFVVLFNNDKFFIKPLLSELVSNKLPFVSVFDTNSLFCSGMYPLYGNDDSSKSVFFYSSFISICINVAKKKN